MCVCVCVCVQYVNNKINIWSLLLHGLVEYNPHDSEGMTVYHCTLVIADSYVLFKDVLIKHFFSKCS